MSAEKLARNVWMRFGAPYGCEDAALPYAELLLEMREAWEAGRVTISAPDFLEWIAARCERFEGLDPNGGAEIDYAVRLRAIAKAARKVLAKADKVLG